MLSIKPIIIAHRGASGYAPENTLIAFKKAKELGVQWVEFDVQIAKCGEPIIIHDNFLNRTTNAKGHIKYYDYQQLSLLDAGQWYHAEYRGEKIPRLSDTLSLLADNSMDAVVEIKAHKGRELLLAEKTVNNINQYWPSNKSLPIVASFNLKVLNIIKQISPTQPIAFGIKHWSQFCLTDLVNLHCDRIHVKQEILNQEVMQRLKQINIQVYAFTVNDKQRASQLFSWGVAGVFSDYPDRV